MLRRKFKALFRKPNLINLFITAGVWLLVSACVFSTNKDSDKVNSNSQNVSTENKSSVSETKSNKKEDNGDFIVRQPALTNARFAALDEKIKREKFLEKAADDLNKALILPTDVYLRSKDCGEANAEFDPNTQTITICYELMEHFSSLYQSEGMTAEEADKKMFDAVRFAFLHEVGHAMIHNYKLPVAGSEEDAADRCSSYINIEELGDAGVRAVLAASDAFRIGAKKNSVTKRRMADEHLLQEQRSFNSLCMIYGSDPEKYAYFVRDGYLPKERAARCSGEYARTVDSWKSLLEPWRKN